MHRHVDKVNLDIIARWPPRHRQHLQAYAATNSNVTSKESEARTNDSYKRRFHRILIRKCHLQFNSGLQNSVPEISESQVTQFWRKTLTFKHDQDSVTEKQHAYV